MLLTGSRRHMIAHKVIAAIVYASAALATGNWLDYALWPEQPHHGPVDTLLRIAVVGSVIFGLASLVSLFRLPYAAALGVLAASLSWIYFALVVLYLPWRDLAQLVRIHDHGDAQVIAILALLVATLYSLFESSKWRQSHLRTHGGAKVG